MMPPKLNFNQCLAIVLIGALCYNGYIHYTHPAYTYYKENIAALRREFVDFRNLVTSDFVPAVSNGFLNVASLTISNQLNLARSSTPHQLSTNSVSRIPYIKFHSPCTMSGRSYVYLGQTMYSVGDYVFGEVIEGITADAVKLGGQYYEVKK